MGVAARAIVIENGQMLVMKRIKQGVEYYTLVGGRLNAGESPEQALIREVKEETGLDVVKAQLVFTEKHPEPYNDQYIFLCEVAPHGELEVQSHSEEAFMNKIDINVHQPVWVKTSMFSRLPFSTMKLQKAISEALVNNFPPEPESL